MTSDVQAGAGASPFAIDAPAMGRALRTYAANRNGVEAYVQAMRAVQLGPQPFEAAGIRGEYDPFKDLRKEEEALRRTWYHTDPPAEVIRSLHSWAATPEEGLTLITTPLIKAKEILASAGPSETLTEKQASDLRLQFYTASIFTRMFANGFAGMSEKMASFIGNLSADHAALTSGVANIGQLRNRVHASGMAESQRYIFYPATRPIGEMIASLTGRVVGQLDHLGRALSGALIGHIEMRGALTAMATAVNSALAKSEDARSAMDRMDRAGLTIAAREARLETALDTWDDLATFFRGSGL